MTVFEVSENATWVDMLKQFHDIYEHASSDLPIASVRTVDPKLVSLRNKLILDELQEWIDAQVADDPVEMFDALLDLIYVCIGTGISYGFPMEEGFREVHRSNLTKLGEDGKPIYNDDGKVVKGPNFELPDLASILERARKENS